MNKENSDPAQTTQIALEYPGERLEEGLLGEYRMHELDAVSDDKAEKAGAEAVEVEMGMDDAVLEAPVRAAR